MHKKSIIKKLKLNQPKFRIKMEIRTYMKTNLIYSYKIRAKLNERSITQRIIITALQGLNHGIIQKHKYIGIMYMSCTF